MKWGAVFNRVKSSIVDAVSRKLDEIHAMRRTRDLQRVVDITLPGRARPAGHVHLLTQVRQQSVEIFCGTRFR